MTDIPALLSELAQVEEGPPVITIALDTHWRNERHRERVRIFVRDQVRDARKLFDPVDDESRGISETLDRIEIWVDEVINRERYESSDGMVLYASEPRGLFVECALPVAADMGLWIDRRPRLWPLALQLEHTRPLILVDVDATGAHITQWQFGRIDEETIEREIQGRHQKGGWSQARYQRNIREDVHRVWKECASRLQQLVLADPRAYIALLGQDANLRGFQRQLPAVVTERVVAMRPSPPLAEKRLSIGFDVLEKERIAHEFAVVHHVLRQGLSDRSGTVGLEETLMAINERQVRELAMARLFDAQGVKCVSCNGLWTLAAKGCVFCGEAVELVSLRDEILRRSIVQDADVVIVADGGPLDAYQGVGSLLRRGLTDVRPPFESTMTEPPQMPPPR